MRRKQVDAILVCKFFSNVVSRTCNSRVRFTTTVFRSGHKHYRPSATRAGWGVHLTKEWSRSIYLHILVCTCSLSPDDRKADFTIGALGRDPLPPQYPPPLAFPSYFIIIYILNYMSMYATQKNFTINAK